MAEAARALACGLLLTAWAHGCLWDRETLAAERAGAPEVYAAVMGAVPGHCDTFYHQRVTRLSDRTDLTAAEADDLAVALFRLDRLDEAERVLRDKEERWPGGYTTWANLGSVLAAAGRLDDAAGALSRAVELGGERAGRERCQLRLVKFRQAVETDATLPLRSTLLGLDLAARLGADFRYVASRAAPDEREREVADRHVQARLGLEPGLVAALAGLLVYGRQDEVEVMFALAELLAARGDRALAWHAYQRALDLGHARRIDLPYYQQQLLPGLDRAVRAELTETAHYRRRRRIVAWVEAWQAHERELIAAGGEAERPEVQEAYLREHPRP